MAMGIRSTVTFSDPEGCPVAEISDTLDTTVYSVTSSIPESETTPVVTEFAIQSPSPPEIERVDSIFSIGSTTLCRVEHRSDQACPCTSLGEFQIPITRFRAHDGSLSIVFHAGTFDELQSIIGSLRDRYESMDIRRLIRQPDESSPMDAVLVNRNRLTMRQLEILELAFDRGYFNRPREINATELADELGIDQSTLAEHMSLGLSKVLEDVLDDRVTDSPPQRTS